MKKEKNNGFTFWRNEKNEIVKWRLDDCEDTYIYQNNLDLSFKFNGEDVDILWRSVKDNAVIKTTITTSELLTMADNIEEVISKNLRYDFKSGEDLGVALYWGMMGEDFAISMSSSDNIAFFHAMTKAKGLQVVEAIRKGYYLNVKERRA